MGKCNEYKVRSNRAVFLDRDGVLTVSTIRDGKGYAPLSLNQFRFYPGVAICINRIKDLGFLPILVSNQPDVANGLLPLHVLEEMNQKIREELEIKEINNCIHNNKDQCSCRKPLPGMLNNSANKLGINLSESWMIGDRDSDVSAGIAAGCRTIFINRNLRAETGELANFFCDSLEKAIDIIAGVECQGGVGPEF
jgi:D-glycero-D-manno-heptose 1,7-bisphosphate phosphatase